MASAYPNDHLGPRIGLFCPNAADIGRGVFDRRPACEGLGGLESENLKTTTSEVKAASQEIENDDEQMDAAQAAKLTEFLNLILRPEPLRKELRRYVTSFKIGRFKHVMLKHPLCVTQLHNGIGHAAQVHQIIDAKKEMIEKAKKAGDWDAVLFLHERPFRLEAFIEYGTSFSGEQYWKSFGDLWTDVENIHPNQRTFLRILKSNKSGREFLMNEDERKALAELPEVLTIYRGYGGKTGHKGLSWTLDRKKAEWFARRWVMFGKSVPYVATAAVHKPNVFAHFTRREESEIVVDPAFVKMIGIERTSAIAL
jgi:hypothetical protein